MIKHLALFLIVFICVSCKHKEHSYYDYDFDCDFDIKYIDALNCDKYDIDYQVLLKKWQKNVNWQKQDSINRAAQGAYICSSEVYDVIRKTLKTHYNFETDDCTNIILANIKKREEHWQVSVGIKELSKYEDAFSFILMLISRTNKTMLSTVSLYVGSDPNQPEIHYNTIMPKSMLSLEDNTYYKYVLLKSKLSDIKWPDYNKNKSKNIDSAAATHIAIAAAAEHYGFKMAPVTARAMGRNSEHWMVYCFPNMVEEFDDAKIAYYADRMRELESGSKGDTAIITPYQERLRAGSAPPGYVDIASCYVGALSVHKYKDAIFLDESCCPEVIVVLISREDGQVIGMHQRDNQCKKIPILPRRGFLPLK